MSSSGDDLVRSSSTINEQWEEWENSRKKIYDLIQQRHNLSRLKSLDPFREFVNGICLKLRITYTTALHQHFVDLWNRLSESEKNSYYWQVGHFLLSFLDNAQSQLELFPFFNRLLTKHPNFYNKKKNWMQRSYVCARKAQVRCRKQTPILLSYTAKWFH